MYAQAAASGLTIATGVLSHFHLLTVNSVEEFCYGKGNVPYQSQRMMAIFQLLLPYGLYCIWFIRWYPFLFVFCMRRPIVELWTFFTQFKMTALWIVDNIYHTIYGAILGIFSCLMLIADYVFILVIREQAKTFFGSSYSDNAMGYGQIIATGFCLQTLSVWIGSLLCMYKSVFFSVDSHQE